MKRLLFIVLGCSILILSAYAQTKSFQESGLLSEAAPESVGISPERLARIDRMCREEVANGDLPGIVSMLVRQSHTIC